MKIVEVTPDNAVDHSFFCIKNIKEPGFSAKQNWFKKQSKDSLKLKVIYADDCKQVGFIEYVPAEFAWRPIDAPDYLFIHCIMVYPNKYRNSGAASALVNEAIKEAHDLNKNGVCTLTSQGPWMATKNLFSNMGFEKTDKLGRFELMVHKLKSDAPDPIFINWENEQKNYLGWNLLYADQCPWHDKGVKAIIKAAEENNVQLKVRKINTAEEARQMPSGFGVFALIKDGKLLEDHYISKKRFETIIAAENG